MFPSEDRDYQQVLGDKAYMLGVSPYLYVVKYTHLIYILYISETFVKEPFLTELS